MKKTILLFLFIIGSFISKGQSTLPPAFEIKADTAQSIDIPEKNWQLLEDPSGKLTFGQVNSPLFESKFHANTTSTKGYDYNITTYWVRYSLKNTLPHSVKVAITEGVF